MSYERARCLPSSNLKPAPQTAFKLTRASRHFNGAYRNPTTPATGTSILKFPVPPATTPVTVAVDFCSTVPSFPMNSKSML